MTTTPLHKAANPTPDKRARSTRQSAEVSEVQLACVVVDNQGLNSEIAPAPPKNFGCNLIKRKELGQKSTL
jgi:hypothetical protein